MSEKDPQQIWKTTMAQIEIKLDSPATYKTFFSGTELVNITEDKAIVGVANAYMRDWLSQKYSQLVRETISHVFGKPLQIDFVAQADFSKGTPPRLEKRELEKPQTATGLLEVYDGIHPSVNEAIVRSGLNDKYNWTSFIVGNSNRIAHAAAQAIVSNPGKVYNPLFLHGKTGVGKTHLAQAIGRTILERNPNKKVVYTSSEGFLNDLVKAIRTNKQIEFRNRYRAVHMLIIDDIQLISKWVDTQAEFFNTFNELYNNNSHVILISDRPPEEIKDLEDRLRSRFQGGLVTDIAQPELELRLAILSKKALASGFEISDRILETIARGVQDNVRELEGALQRVALFNQMKPSGDLTVEEVNRIIGNDALSKREKVRVPALLKEVSRQMNVPLKELKGPRRTQDIALARQVAMYILREELDYNLEEVANFLNRSDHTTVLHAVDKVKSQMLVNDSFKAQVISIVRSIQERPLDD